MVEPADTTDKHCHFYEPPDEIYAIEEGARWIIGGLDSLRTVARGVLELDGPSLTAAGNEDALDFFYSLHCIHERVAPRNRTGVEWDRRSNMFASWDTRFSFEWLFDRARTELRGIPSFLGRSYSSTTQLVYEVGRLVTSTVFAAYGGRQDHEEHPVRKCMNQSIYDMADSDKSDAVEYIESNLEVTAQAVMHALPPAEYLDCHMLKIEVRREACLAWQIYDRLLPESTRSPDEKSADAPQRDPSGFYSAGELAAEYGLDQTALEARLRRFRIGNDAGWHEIADAKPREPKFRYRLQAVSNLIEQMKAAKSPKA